jgi:hypothetical protein
MEKVEKNLLKHSKKGKNVIRASTILEITLEDYHESRKLYEQPIQNPNNQNGVKTDVLYIYFKLETWAKDQRRKYV